MMEASELKDKVKALQSASSEGQVTAILKDLKTNAKINEKLLRETKAGLAVGKLRSHASREVSDLAKELVKKWKTEVEKAKNNSRAGSSGSPTPPEANGRENGSVKFQGTYPPTITTSHSPTLSRSSTGATTTTTSPTTPRSATDGASRARSAATDGVRFSHTGDRTRDTCAQLIYDALASDSGAPIELISKRAQAIEQRVYEQHEGRIQGEYRNKMRSLFSNLKDKSNPGLRESVVSGDLRVARLCAMTSQDMASEERRAADEKIRQEAIFNTLAAGEREAETDAFQCGKCKQWKTRYRQAQTRSADEPMTTFVTCTNCNNRWKFS